MTIGNPRLDSLTGALRLTVALSTVRFGLLRWVPADGALGAASQAGTRDLVFLHTIASSAAGARPLAEALVAEGWSVDALDMPGHGESAWLGPRGEPLGDQGSVPPDLYELSATAMLVRQAIEALNLPMPPALVGHGWGAAVALLVAGAGRVERTVLLDPPFITQLDAVRLADRLAAQLRPTIDEARDAIRANSAESADSADSASIDAQDLETRAVALTQTSEPALRAICSATASWSALANDDVWRDAMMNGPFHVILGSSAGYPAAAAQAARLRRIVGADRVLDAPAPRTIEEGTELSAFLGPLRTALRRM